MDSIARLLSTNGYITVNKTLIKLFGLNSAVMLGELCSEFVYWQDKGNLIEGSFYSTRENIEENTGLNEYRQRKALSDLTEQGIVSIVKRGMPAVNYYEINFEQLFKFLSTSTLKFKEQDVKNLKPNNNKEIKIKNKVSISKDIDTRDSAEPNVSPFKLSTKKLATKPNLYASCINLIDDFVSKNKCLKIRQLLIDHLDIMCESDKLHGKKQYEGILKKLYEYGNKNSRYKQIIEYSIEHGYATFYPLDEYKPINRKECPEVISNPHKVERFDDTDEKVMNRFTKQLKKEGKLNEF